jgi:mannose-6-phosphate isomerase-like protein (cupin superfamily)
MDRNISPRREGLRKMKPLVVKQAEVEEYFTGERCYIRELIGGDRDPGLSFALARVEPGVTTALHSLAGTSERYVIISGRGLMEVGTLLPTAVGPGDLVLIPPGTPQRITNDGSEDLVFCCVCAPEFTPRAYVDLEIGGRDQDP